MKIINQTKNIILANQVSESDQFWSRLRGLLFQPLWKKYEALYLKSCKSIHTFGLSQTIDIIYISQGGRILECKTIKPWRISIGPRLSRGVIELPAGTCQVKHCEVNDQLIQVSGKGW